MAPGENTNKRTHVMSEHNPNGTDQCDGAEVPTRGAAASEASMRQKSSSKRNKKNKNKNLRKSGSDLSNGHKNSADGSRVGEFSTGSREGSESSAHDSGPSGLSNENRSGLKGTISVSQSLLSVTSDSQSNYNDPKPPTSRKQTSSSNSEVHDHLKTTTEISEDQVRLIANMDLTEAEERMVKSACFVSNLMRNQVLIRLQALKQQHRKVTNEQLLDSLLSDIPPYVVGSTQQYPTMSKPQNLSENSGHNAGATGGQVNGNNAASLQSQGGSQGQLTSQFQNTSQGSSYQPESETETVETDGQPEPLSQSNHDSTTINGLTDDDDDESDCVDGLLSDFCKGAKQHIKKGKKHSTSSSDHPKQGTSMTDSTARSEQRATINASQPAGASSSRDEGAVGTSSNGVRSSRVNSVAKKNPAMHLAICLELAKREYKLLDKGRYCIVCETKPRDVTFLPCGHIYACKTCSEPIYTCPRCERSILATVNTYLC